MQASNTNQSYYTKQPDNTGTMSQVPDTVGSQKNKNFKFKSIFAVVGLVLFAIIAAMGVLIAQRQVAQNGESVTPVAPNAPQSQPKAAEDVANRCAMTFTVTSDGAVNCTNKTALKDFGGAIIAPNTSFNVGDEFVFKITVKQEGTFSPATNVQVIDTLPNSLEFVSAAPGSSGISNSGQKVTATIGTMQPGETKNVEFKVKVTDGNYGSNTNTATATADDGSSAICSYPYIIAKGTAECAKKELYSTVTGALVTEGNKLERGLEYEYRISAKITNKPFGEVIISDVIPEELEYVGVSDKNSEYEISYDSDTNTLTANIGEIDSNETGETISLGFIVRVPEDPELGEFTNTASVYILPFNSQKIPQDQSVCSATHTILPIGSAECSSKKAFTTGGVAIPENSDLSIGQEFDYALTITADETTTGEVTVTDTLPTGLEFISETTNTKNFEYDSNSRTISATFPQMNAGQSETILFRVQVVANPTVTSFKNTATVTTAGGSNTSESSCSLTLNLEKKYECNSECTTNENCSDLGEDHICYKTDSGKSYCRLANNPQNLQCKAVESTPPPTGPATPPPTPAPGCNDLCIANADCSNSSHICVTTNDGSNRCRLAEYTASTTCTEPTVAATPGQPVLPETLPETGPEDWLNWLKAGLVTLGVGTALFLLL